MRDRRAPRRRDDRTAAVDREHERRRALSRADQYPGVGVAHQPGSGCRPACPRSRASISSPLSRSVGRRAARQLRAVDDRERVAPRAGRAAAHVLQARCRRRSLRGSYASRRKAVAHGLKLRRGRAAPRCRASGSLGIPSEQQACASCTALPLNPGIAPANPNAHGNARVAAHTQMTGRRCRTATGFRSPPSAPAKHDVQLLAVVEISRPKCRRRRPPKWRPDSASINRSQGAVPTLLEIEQG
jgi:hypothetical protein